MEPAQTPLMVEASSNENIFTNVMKPQDNQTPSNVQSNIQVGQYFYDHDPNYSQVDISPIILYPSSYCCRNFGIFFFVFIIPVVALILFISYKFDQITIVLLIFFSILDIVIIILILKNCTKKYIISKDENKKRLYIQSLNYFGKNRLNFDLCLETYHFQCTEKIDSDENGTAVFHKVILLNDLKNKNEYNLDTSNIKEIPLILIYSFQISLQRGTHKQLENRLNNYINSKNYNNAIDQFEFKYIPKNRDQFLYFCKSKCVKFCDNFITFFFNRYQYEYNYDDQAVRIDFIYSESFDRIFIGVVQNYQKSYIKTFLFNTNTIDKFILQANQLEGYDLRIMLKENNEIQTIWQIKKERQDDLEGLAFLLNERFANNNDIITNSNN